MKLNRLLKILLTIVLFSIASNSFAGCPSGQHKGLFGWCYPNIGGDVGAAAQAIKQGHQYCVTKPVGYNQTFCSGCWSAFGGEGGRMDCGARLCGREGCNVDYGRCEEDRNRSFCSNLR